MFKNNETHILDVSGGGKCFDVLVAYDEDGNDTERLEITLSKTDATYLNRICGSDAERAVWWSNNILDLLLDKQKKRVRDMFNKFDFESNPEVLNRIETLLIGGEK
jgi:hypothetical protein